MSDINFIPKPKTIPEIRAELAKIDRIEEERNRQMFGPDSLHAKGYLSPICPYCSVKASLRFVLGLPSITNELRPRQTSHISKQELEEQTIMSRVDEINFEQTPVENIGGKVNDW